MSKQQGAHFVIPPGFAAEKYLIRISECKRFKHLIRIIPKDTGENVDDEPSTQNPA